ncbi:MAG: HlyD family efflux transporter periplasmic adaptor subunit [Thermosynechococcaceae cyanobacterium MS004]|nr:HlyD family efflux transporter periplasmic adaptor subunit [Thermosynechococcaceae cyanobacterium MS004]
MIRILLVTPQSTFEQQVRRSLQLESDLEIVGVAPSHTAAQTLSQRLQPDLALVDLERLGESGLTYIRWLTESTLSTQAIALSSQAEKATIEEALRLGAKGYLLKSTAAKDLAQSLALAHRGFLQLSPGLFEMLSLQSLQTLGTHPDQVTVLEDSRWPITNGANHANHSLGSNSSNGSNGSNGSNSSATATALAARPVSALASSPPSAIVAPNPAQDVLLKPSPLWSQLLVWSILGCAIAVGAWATLYQFEEAIPAVGQLEPQGSVKEVQPPVSGVVRNIRVKEGQQVKKGDVLLELDQKGSESELKSLEQIRTALLSENAAYQQVLASPSGSLPVQLLPANMVKLAENRRAFAQENDLYRAQLQTESPNGVLTAAQQRRQQSSALEASSRTLAAQLEVSQLQKRQVQIQVQLESAKQSLNASQQILQDITPAVEAGAIARIQLTEQQEAVQKAEATVRNLEQQRLELDFAIDQARARVQNTVASSSKDLYGSIALNDKQIADIDSRFTKAILDNQRQITDLENRIRQATLTQQYQAVRSPSDGVVFDLQAKAPGFVATASQPILKIVPSDRVVAKVFISNRDIGFVRKNMPADIRVDAYPFSEFGDIKGTIDWIGSDALPPTQIRPYYSFPVRIKLNSQSLSTGQAQKLPLQVGMAIQVNIKLRKRTVISIVTDQFTNQADRLKTIH